ncbi:MAG: GEVED domain-containing protein [Flavobacteriales bacterium]
MKRNLGFSLFYLTLLFVLKSTCLSAQNVLIIYDDSISNPNTQSLKLFLENEGMEVQFSEVTESNWNNTNPSLDDFNAVIHLNGDSYGYEMPNEGQVALTNFVKNNEGKYIGFEWNAWQYFSKTQLQSMGDLILFDYISYIYDHDIDLQQVPEQSTHPVLKDIPSNFSLFTSTNLGKIRNFNTYPTTLLMTEGENDALAFRPFHSGYVLNFHLAGNYYNHSLSNLNVQKIISNFIKIDYEVVDPLQICTSKGKRSRFEWIKQINIGNDFEVVYPYGNNGYFDFTSSHINIESGEEIAIKLTPGFKNHQYKEYWSIWMDLNNDNLFSPDELIYRKMKKGEVQDYLVLPQNMNAGTYKVRIAMKWKGYSQPCENFNNGEVIDFSIVIQ